MRAKIHVTVVIDGYDDLDNIKKSKELRRYPVITPHGFRFLKVLRFFCNQDCLFGNTQSKKQLIIMLSTIPKNNIVMIRDLWIRICAKCPYRRRVVSVEQFNVIQDINTLIILNALTACEKHTFLKKQNTSCEGESITFTSLGDKPNGMNN